VRLAFQLDNFIDDMIKDDRFTKVQSDLYKLVYLLLKLVLFLPVATASVERVFSSMNIVKTNIKIFMVVRRCIVM
jgi:hypothetical protein